MVLEAGILLHLFLVKPTVNIYTDNGKDYFYWEIYKICGSKSLAQETLRAVIVEAQVSPFSVVVRKEYNV